MHGKYLDGNTFVVELDVQITFTLWKYESPAVIKVYSSAPFDVQTYGEPPIILEERIFLVNDTSVHLSIHADFLERENHTYRHRMDNGSLLRLHSWKQHLYLQG